MIKQEKEAVSTYINQCNVQQQIINKPLLSSQYTKYRQIIPSCTLSKPQIHKKLQNAQFIYHLQHSFEFKSQIIYSNKFSITYSLEYGHFKHNLQVYASNINIHDVIFREYVSNGIHAHTESFVYNKKQIAAKIIKVQQIDQLINESVLREVFLLKIASALQVGPQFINAYGYDLIMSGNKIEFLMERCVKKHCQSPNESLKLREGLSIMHEINLIHGDINNSNILWSNNKNKHVFIDFGLSYFIREELGNKSMKYFQGTYQYCSKQMQIAFYLKKAMFIDVYYNDLFGTEKFIKTDIAQKQQGDKSLKVKKSKLKQRKTKNSQNEQSEICDWNAVIRFFRFNFMALEQKYDLMLSLLKKQSDLIQTFQLLFKQAISTIKQPMIRKLYRLCLPELSINQPNIEQIDENTLDGYLYIKVMSQASLIQKYFKKITYNNVNQIINMGNFKQYWNQQCHKFQIFQLLYLDMIQNESSHVQILETKQKIAIQINSLYGVKPINQLESSYLVITRFRQLFYQIQDLKYLIIIKDLFQFMVLYDQVQKTSQMISRVFQIKQKSYKDYLLAAHSYLYSKLCFYLSKKGYWQIYYSRNYLKNKPKLELIQLLFTQLIDLKEQNLHKIKCTASFLNDPQLSQILQDCIDIKACYFCVKNHPKKQQILKYTQQKQLYSSTQNFHIVALGNMCIKYLNGATYYRKIQRQIVNQKYRSLIFVNTIRDLDIYQVNNTEKFFTIIKNYYNMLNQKKCISLYTLQNILLYIQSALGQIKKCEFNNLIKWISKFHQLVVAQKIQRNIDDCVKMASGLISLYTRLYCTKKNQTSQSLKVIKDKIKLLLSLLNQTKNYEYYKIQGFLSIIELNETNYQLQSIQEQITKVLKFAQKNELYLSLQFSSPLLYFVSQKLLSHKISLRQNLCLFKIFRSYFDKAFQNQLKNGNQKLPLDVILKVIYNSEEADQLLMQFLLLGDVLKKKGVTYSPLSIRVTRNFMVLIGKAKHSIKKQIFSWKFVDIYMNPYRAAFALSYLSVNPIQYHYHSKQDRRLLALSVYGLSEFDFGCFDIELQITVWGEIDRVMGNRRNRKSRLISLNLMRKWCKYECQNNSIKQLCVKSFQKYLMMRKKLKIFRKKINIDLRCLENVQIIFKRKFKKIRNNLQTQKL